MARTYMIFYDDAAFFIARAMARDMAKTMARALASAEARARAKAIVRALVRSIDRALPTATSLSTDRQFLRENKVNVTFEKKSDAKVYKYFII
jgi:hypothetical protein